MVAWFDINGIAAMWQYISPYSDYLIAASVIVAVLVLATMVYRALAGQIRGRRGSRLGITEYHEIDKSRRLVLIRRDGVEHLLLIGGMQDIVVENGIGREDEHLLSRNKTTHFEAIPVPDEEHRPIPIRPAPRPAVFGDRKPNLRPVDRGEPRFSEPPNFEPDGKS